MLRNGAVLQAVKCWLESSRSFLSWFRQPFHSPSQTGFSYLNPFRRSLFRLASFCIFASIAFLSPATRRSLLFHRIPSVTRICEHIRVIRNVVALQWRGLHPFDYHWYENHRPINLTLISVVNTICRITLWTLVSTWLCAFCPYLRRNQRDFLNIIRRGGSSRATFRNCLLRFFRFWFRGILIWKGT